MMLDDPNSSEVLLHPFGLPSTNEVFGDPDDPTLASDVDSLDGHEVQDAEYEAEHAADIMLEVFLAGMRAGSVNVGEVGTYDPAFALGELVGTLIRGQVALNPDLAPILKALTK